MDPILDLARELGKRLAENPRVKVFRAASDALAKSDTTRQLLADYENQARRVEDLQASNQPIEPQDKRRLLELEQKMASDPLMKTFLRAQVDYLDLMRQVNDAIDAAPESEPRT